MHVKRFAASLLPLAFVLALVGCGRTGSAEQYNTQYFFSGKVIEAGADYLLLEVDDTGNTELSVGARVEVSTEVTAADGCPAFSTGEYAKVLMARNAAGGPPGRLDALAIYQIDETGKPIAD